MCVHTRFIETDLLPIEVLLCWNMAFRFFGSYDLDLDLINTNLTRVPLRYTKCAKMNFLCRCFRKLSSDRHVQPDRQTEPKLVNDWNDVRVALHKWGVYQLIDRMFDCQPTAKCGLTYRDCDSKIHVHAGRPGSQNCQQIWHNVTIKWYK